MRGGWRRSRRRPRRSAWRRTPLPVRLRRWRPPGGSLVRVALQPCGLLRPPPACLPAVRARQRGRGHMFRLRVRCVPMARTPAPAVCVPLFVPASLTASSRTLCALPPPHLWRRPWYAAATGTRWLWRAAPASALAPTTTPRARGQAARGRQVTAGLGTPGPSGAQGARWMIATRRAMPPPLLMATTATVGGWRPGLVRRRECGRRPRASCRPGACAPSASVSSAPATLSPPPQQQQ